MQSNRRPNKLNKIKQIFSKISMLFAENESNYPQYIFIVVIKSTIDCDAKSLLIFGSQKLKIYWVECNVTNILNLLMFLGHYECQYHS